MWKRTICYAAILVMAHASMAASQASDGRRGFDRLARLAGAWTMSGQARQGAVTTYRLTDGGKTLIQDEDGQKTVFSLAGDDLTLIHYCARGNQPRMRLQTLNDGKITFAMYDITNLKHPRDYHTTAMEVVFLSDDRVDLIYRGMSDGRGSTQVVNLKRKN